MTLSAWKYAAQQVNLCAHTQWIYIATRSHGDVNIFFLKQHWMLTGSGSSSFSCNFFNAPFDSFILYFLLFCLYCCFGSSSPISQCFVIVVLVAAIFSTLLSSELCFSTICWHCANLFTFSQRTSQATYIDTYMHAYIHTYIHRNPKKKLLNC